jgi:hypothetical protein
MSLINRYKGRRNVMAWIMGQENRLINLDKFSWIGISNIGNKFQIRGELPVADGKTIFISEFSTYKEAVNYLEIIKRLLYDDGE